MSKIKENHRRLLEIAGPQQGLFTTRQAIEAGYSAKNHAYHLLSGSWRRLRRGIYFLTDYPATDDPGLVLWTLWSRNRFGRPQGVFSHETALGLHGLSDLNPAKMHMTVPRGFRRNNGTPKVLVLHRAGLKEEEVEDARGYRLTRPLKTILDLAQAATVPPDILFQSLAQGLRQGLITLPEARRAELQAPLRDVLNAFIREVKRGQAA